MRLRRSNSTPSDTRPATSRRTTLNTSRSSPAPATASASGTQVGALAADVVDGAADEEGDEHAHAHRGGGEHEGDDDSPAVGARESRAAARTYSSRHYFTY